MQLTQEKKFFIQKARLSNVEQTIREMDNLETHNLIEESFKDDLLHQICGNKEIDFQQAKSETGTFYFFNDYGKDVKYDKN